MVAGRAVERCRHAMNLALTSKRLFNIFRSIFRTLRLDGFENVILDKDNNVASFLRYAGANVKELYLTKWFDRRSMSPCLHVIVSQFPRLEELSIHGFRDRGLAPALMNLLKELAPHLKRLSLVSLSWFDDFSSKADDTLSIVSANCPLLHSVELGNARGISHYTLVALWIAIQSRLKSVYLHSLRHFSLGDHTLHDMVSNCRNIHTLNITNMAGITRQGLRTTPVLVCRLF